MATLSKKNTVTSKTLMTAKECALTFFSSKDAGIRFFVQGSEIPVLANLNNVVSTDNCVVIGNETSKIMLVEHFMAACAFAGINALDVCISFPELPILDGSAVKWFEMFQESGIAKDYFGEPIELNNPVVYTDEKAAITAIPSDSFKITYLTNFSHPDLSNRWVSFSLNDEKKQILEARTFGYLKDLERFQQIGLALGVTPENTVGLTEDGYTTELRSQYEPVKHKILDLIGDLYLAGINPFRIKAHIIAKEAGHKSHVDFAKKLIQVING